MTHLSGNSTNGKAGVAQEPVIDESVNSAQVLDPLPSSRDFATRAKHRAKEQIKQNRFVFIAAGSIVVALLVFVATSAPRRNTAQKPKAAAAANAGATISGEGAVPSDKSLFPITDSGRPVAKETHEGFLNEQDMQRTAMPHHRIPGTFDSGQASAPGTLASIPPFGDQGWQAPPYQPGTNANSGAETPDLDKAENGALEKSSLVFVRSASAAKEYARGRAASINLEPEIGLGLNTGARLRARLETAASTAVRTPVLAVVEYNYERAGEIIVPAGAKAVGHVQDADRSGYVRVQFDSLMMPDGAAVPIQAVATDLELRPLKGKVEGKNTGKNVLVRSFSGIGQVGAMLVGRGNLNQPLSESDLLRERVGNNIGEAGDEQVSKLAVTQRIVVTIAAGTPIYVVFEQTPKTNAASVESGLRSAQPANVTNAEELRQLLQLQRELNQPAKGDQ
jgi:hypothetical protein